MTITARPMWAASWPLHLPRPRGCLLPGHGQTDTCPCRHRSFASTANANQPWHPGKLSGVCHERPLTNVVRAHHVLIGSNPEFEPGFALMPALREACKHSTAIQTLPTRTEVHSFGRGRIEVRHEKLSDRGPPLQLSWRAWDGSGADNANASPTDLHSSAPRGGGG
jgi:hypothetical protein